MILQYPIEDLIIISGAREQKKRKPAYSKGNVGASKNAGQAAILSPLHVLNESIIDCGILFLRVLTYAALFLQR